MSPGASTVAARGPRLLIFASLAMATSMLGLGTVFLVTEATAMGFIALGVGLHALLPLGMLRAGVSPAAGARTFFATGFPVLGATMWATGGSLSPVWPSIIVMPSLMALLLGARGLLAWVLGLSTLPLAVLAIDLMGRAPPSFVPAGWAQPLTLILTILGVGLAFLVARIFELNHLRASSRLLRAQRSVVDLLGRLQDAGGDLRAAAETLTAERARQDGAPPGGAGDQVRAEPAEEARSLVEAMRVESARGRALVSQATQTVEGFVRSQDRIRAGFATLSTRLDEVAQVAQTLDRIANRLESMALGFQIEGASVGAQGARFATVGGGMGRLAAAVADDARQIHATLGAITAATAVAETRVAEAEVATDDALGRLEALAATFESVSALVERAAGTSDEVVSATLGHLDLLGEELERARQGQETTTAAEAKRRAIARNLPTLIAVASGTALVAAGTLAAMGIRALPPFLAVTGVLAALPVALPSLRGRTRLGGHVFLLATGTLVLGGAALSGGMSSPAVPALVLMPLGAIFFFDARAGLAWAGVSAVAALALFGAGRGGVLPPFSVSPLVERALHAGLESIFLLIAAGYSTWLAKLLGEHAEALLASDRPVRGALDHVEQGSGALAHAMAELAGDGQQTASLVDRLERETRGAEVLTRETRASFGALTVHAAGIERAGADAHAQAEALSGLLARVGEISSELDLLAIQTAIEAVQAGQVAAGFQVLSREATRLAAAVKADVADMQRSLQLARDAVGDARDGARRATQETGEATAAVEDLTRAFDNVYALAARGAHAGRALTERSGRHLAALRRGLLETAAAGADEGGLR